MNKIDENISKNENLCFNFSKNNKINFQFSKNFISKENLFSNSKSNFYTENKNEFYNPVYS